jgi:hypothetical protein
MSTSAFRSWTSSGKPFTMAQPIADLTATLRRHGYTVGTIGNSAHLAASRPEDHCPFSATGWPVPSPYPYVHACDVMPPAAGSGLPSLAQLGAQLVADRTIGEPGMAWLKYLNWSPAGGSCRHESWTPVHSIKPSGDVGHIHLSARSDFTHSACAAGYDPVARVRHSAPDLLPPLSVPAWPGRLLHNRSGRTDIAGSDVERWQHQMKARGWKIGVDGVYGAECEDVCRRFQHEKKLRVDGIVGPRTWSASWTAPVT